LGTLGGGACRSAEDVGLQLADAKRILGRLQEIVVSEQLQRYGEAVRPCPRCHRRRHLKDYRRRRFDTVFGKLAVRAPRFDGCRHCGEGLIASPVSELLPERVSPELRHLQTELAAQLPYRQAAALLDELLPETGGLNHATTCNRTLAVGKRIEQEIREEILTAIDILRDFWAIFCTPCFYHPAAQPRAFDEWIRKDLHCTQVFQATTWIRFLEKNIPCPTNLFSPCLRAEADMLLKLLREVKR
jgi:hypothetical protein